PAARAFVDAGFSVLGVDTDARKVERLRRGEVPLRHLGDGFAEALLATGRFEATTDHALLAQADAVLICVPTPLAAGDEPDLSFVTGTARAVAATLRPAQLVVLESTTWPG